MSEPGVGVAPPSEDIPMSLYNTASCCRASISQARQNIAWAGVAAYEASSSTVFANQQLVGRDPSLVGSNMASAVHRKTPVARRW